jgi:hypothetical protein
MSNPETTTAGHGRPVRTLRALVVLLGTLAVATGVLTTTAAPASAGQVGVTVGIRGAGAVTVVEGSLEDGATGTCQRHDNQDHRVTVWCPRFRNSEVLEAWVWLRATPAGSPRGHWVFDGWSGCDRTRDRDGHTECAVHSGAFSSDERQPVARFLDVVRPEIWGPVASPVSDKDLAFRFAFGATDGVTECSIVGRLAWFPCASGHEVTVPEGVHRFAVRATDPSGNADVAEAEVEAIDTRISSGPAATTNDPTPSFRLHTVAGEGLWCALDDGPWTLCGTGPDATYDLPAVADGEHRLLVQARHFQWVDPVPAVWRWTTDTVAPTTAIAVRPDGSRAEVTLVAPDAVSFACRLDMPSRPGTWDPCPAAFTYVGLADGEHTLAVRATDAAGNVESPAAVHRWTVTTRQQDPGTDPTPVPDPTTHPVPVPGDTTAPETTITSGPSGYVLSPSASFGLGSEPGATYRCDLDGRSVPCGSSVALAGLASGTHRLSVAAVDAAGNVDATPAVRTWTVPVTARELPITRGWRLRRTAAAYGGSRLESTRRDARLTRKVNDARSVALVVGKGRRHGTVKVYAGSRLLRTVRLAAPRTAARVVVPVASFATPYTGRLHVVVATQGRPVRIEGLGVATG